MNKKSLRKLENDLGVAVETKKIHVWWKCVFYRI